MPCQTCLHNAFNSTCRGGCLTQTKVYARGARRYVSCPLPHLLGKWALRAIRIVPHAKVFIDLKQTLLIRDGSQELLAPRIISKKARRSSFQSAIRQTRRQLPVFVPNVGIFGQPEAEKHVGENVRNSGFADERHLLG